MALPTVWVNKGVAGLALTFALMGCTERAAGPGQASEASTNPAATEVRFDAWLGQWEGSKAHRCGWRAARAATK
jgi:uncharacterized lipoprotein NlpE involved in copper resistance